jgi:hypothetical protein
MEEFKFEELTDTEKKILLSAFDHSVNENREIIDSQLKEKVLSNINNRPLTLDNAALLPGSLKVVDSNPISISKYLREEIEKDGH